MLMLHSSERDTERVALAQLSVADKRGRLVLWAAEQCQCSQMEKGNGFTQGEQRPYLNLF